MTASTIVQGVIGACFVFLSLFRGVWVGFVFCSLLGFGAFRARSFACSALVLCMLFVCCVCSKCT